MPRSIKAVLGGSRSLTNKNRLKHRMNGLNEFTLDNHLFLSDNTGFWGFGEIGRASCRERV